MEPTGEAEEREAKEQLAMINGGGDVGVRLATGDSNKIQTDGETS